MAKTKKKIREKVPFQKALLFDENELELSTSGRFGKEGGCESLSELNQYLDDMAELIKRDIQKLISVFHA